VRIGVDATCWANGRGYGRFARELLRELVQLAPTDEFVCIGDQRSLDAFDLRAPNLTRVAVPLSETPAVAAAADGNRSPADMLRLTRAVWRERLDVFFSPSVYTYFPLPPGLRAVVTVHDAIAERFPALTLPSPRARLFWNAKVRLALAQARIILTVSEFSARDIERVLGVPRKRIRVAVEAPAPEYRPSSADEIDAARARIGLPPGASWFVYVGGFNPHKRIDAIIKAHAEVVHGVGAAVTVGGGSDDASAAPHLLLVGRTTGDVFHSEIERLRRDIAAAGTGDLVHWTGFLPDAELRPLLSGAAALVLPSECEGFGLPAIEAAACGAPVIATTESPLPQLLDGGGFFVPPGESAALTDAMARLHAEPALRARLGARALERTRELSWRRSAEAALDALREAAA
jgi:glycosyltransferase involved in cell wall biosynthesis